MLAIIMLIGGFSTIFKEIFMKALLVVMLVGSATLVLANGGFHGAYLGKGTVESSCGSSKEFTSAIQMVSYDPGTDLYYGFKFADGVVEHVASSITLHRYWKAIFGSNLILGRHISYENCPERDACEGAYCCGLRENDDSSAVHSKAMPGASLGIVMSSSEDGGRRKYPTKTEVELKHANGKQVSLAWVKEEKRHADIVLEGRIVRADGCVHTWKDRLVWHDKLPEGLAASLDCYLGCSWKDTN